MLGDKTNSWLTLGPCGSSNHAERRVVGIIVAGAGDDGGGSPGPCNGVMAMVVRAGMREREMMAHAGMWRCKVGRFLDELRGFCCFLFGLAFGTVTKLLHPLAFQIACPAHVPGCDLCTVRVLCF